MNQDYNREPQQDDKLNKAIGVSVIFHALIFFIFAVKTIFFSPEKIDFSAAVRVDIVALPEKMDTITLPPPKTPEATKTELAKPEPKPTPVAKVEKPTPPPPTKKETEAINLNKQKSKEKAALDKLKAMAALDKIQEDVANEQKKEAAAKKTTAAKVKGNVLSAGSALSGLSKLQHDTYISDLDSHIKQHWFLSELLAKKDYKAQVRVRIDENGQIISRQIFKSSGNPSYDAAVLATIDKSAPFPRPPEKFSAIVQVDGILIGFPE